MAPVTSIEFENATIYYIQNFILKNASFLLERRGFSYLIGEIDSGNPNLFVLKVTGWKNSIIKAKKD